MIQRWRVDSEHVGRRLDNALMGYTHHQLPKSVVYKNIRTGQVRVNGKRVKVDYRLQSEDEIRIPPALTHAKQAVASAAVSSFHAPSKGVPECTRHLSEEGKT